MTSHFIRELGFDWPKYPVIEEYCVFENDEANLFKTVEKLKSSKAFYKKQINDAYKFKMQHNVDYSDFTNNFDDYIQKEHQLNQAITYIEKIIEAIKK